MPQDDLYERYQAVYAAHREHQSACGDCTDTCRCPIGQQLFERFTTVQDAYLNRQRQQRR
ncbi:hypothetical protein [Streptomyces umbrinus]|uniref:hypothetical protein n=1 Tax=Streptomyces umbrinus TaxID=67370 RepID=UPI003C30706B